MRALLQNGSELTNSDEIPYCDDMSFIHTRECQMERETFARISNFARKVGTISCEGEGLRSTIAREQMDGTLDGTRRGRRILVSLSASLAFSASLIPLL